MSQNLDRETKKSLATNAFLAFIGGLLALALGLQANWGAWGLLACIFPSSALGWILADWRGFVSAFGRAWRRSAETLPECWADFRSGVSRKYRNLKQENRELGYYRLVILCWSWTLIPFVAVMIKASASASHAFTNDSFVSICALTTILMSLMAFVGIALPWERQARIFQRILSSQLTPTRPYFVYVGQAAIHETLEHYRLKYPEDWQAAASETRKWSRRVLWRWNPLVALLLGLWFALVGLGWLLARTPGVLWSLAVLGARLLKLTYLYANADKRRIAFSSIALGMAIGFALGYRHGLVLPGALVSGALTWCLGYLQHRFLYQALWEEKRGALG